MIPLGQNLKLPTKYCKYKMILLDQNLRLPTKLYNHKISNLTLPQYKKIPNLEKLANQNSKLLLFSE